MSLFTKEEVEFVQQRACERVREILDSIGIEYSETNNYLQSCCPVHKGDNPRAFFWNLTTNHWRCATKQCEKDLCTGPSSSIYGLVRGVLSANTGKPTSFIEALNVVKTVLGINGQVDTSGYDADIGNFIKKNKKKKSVKKGNKGSPLSDFKPQLIKDSVYYPSRGISDNTLERYHVSYCDNPNRQFFQRAFFPVLDWEGQNVLGWSGRSIWNQCEKCKLYHNPEWSRCPDKRKTLYYGKWMHSKGFLKEKSLYNIWYAHPHIKLSKTATIVESPGDCWALEEAGIKNSVGILGVNLHTAQRRILQKAGALTLLIGLNKDEAGNKGKQKIIDELNCFFRLRFLELKKNDFGQMTKEEIRDVFKKVQ